MNIKEWTQESYDSWQALKTSYQTYSNQYFTKETNNESILETLMPKAFYDFQKTLLKNVIQCHEDEKNIDPDTEATIRKYFSVKALRNKYQGTYSLHNIYYMQENCHYYFIGDLHSDAYILNTILDTMHFFEKVFKQEKFKLVFLGDYVDRGNQHLKILQDLMILKTMFPKHIYLLTGNHDIGKIENDQVTLYLRKAEPDIAYFYLYIQELYKKDPAFDDELRQLYLHFMNSLNIMALITEDKASIKAVHGGIPRPDDQEGFDYLTQHEQFTDDSLDHLKFRIRDCILWSDPSIQDNKPTLEMKRFKFYENQLINFQDHLGIDTLIRGHQAVEEGYLELFNHRIYTVFSSGSILKDGENINPDTAYDFVMPKILHYDHEVGLPMKCIDLNREKNATYQTSTKA
jgi:hypothetical protein